MRPRLFIGLFYNFAVAYQHGFDVFARTGRAAHSAGWMCSVCHVVVNLVLNVVCDSVKKKEKYIKGVSY